MTLSDDRVALLDDHAHPFPLEARPLDLAGITLDVDARPGADERRKALAPGRFAVEALRNRLAAYLDCAAEDVEAARDERAADWPAYVRELFADADVAGLLLDGGPHPLGLAALAQQARLAGAPTWGLFRIESVIDPMIEAGAGADDALAALAAAIDSAASDGAVGCKTVLAYRTGLAVDASTTVAQAQASLTDSAGPTRTRGKALRDLAMRRSLAQCADLRLPMQIHTGFGDSDLRLAGADPVGLDDLLRTPEGEAADVVLIHAAYPWHEQVAYLSAVRSRVWAEFSLVNLVAPANCADRLLRLVELAPTGRILLGTDGHGPPETHWQAAHVLREAWSVVRGRLAASVRGSWLDDVERAIFRENAEQLYRLT